MPVSVIDPIGKAINHTTQVTFRPFHLGKWFALGFTAFLAGLGQGGGGLNTGLHLLRLNPFRTAPHGPSLLVQTLVWIENNAHLTLTLALVALVVLAAVFILREWLQSRGHFMWIDNIIHQRHHVREPWRAYRSLGNSLFKLNLAVGLTAYAIVLGTLIAAGYLSWNDLRTEQLSEQGLNALLLLIGVAFPVVFFYWKYKLLNADFVAPIMYAQNLRAVPAWRLFIKRFLIDAFWQLVLFYLMRMVLGVAVGTLGKIVLCLVGVLTACIGLLPYLSTVAILPLRAFHRSYSLFYLAQFDLTWQLFATEPDETSVTA